MKSLVSNIVVLILASLACAMASNAAEFRPLFPTDLPTKEWVNFKAAGFSKPACGVVYGMSDTVTCGMALGGIDTGCIDLDTSGLLGYCTIFNTVVPRRGPLNLPILGLSVGGKTWVLCNKQPKKGDGPTQISVEPVFTDLKLNGVQTAKGIRYWGHYPVADVEFETDAPISVGLRSWSPFLPGDVKDSMIPGIVFEVHLRNESRSAQAGTLAFSFPGPTKKESGSSNFVRRNVSGGFNGVCVSAEQARYPMSYAIGTIGEKARTGGELGADGRYWADIAKYLPGTLSMESGASVAVDFSLEPRAEKTVRFVLTWWAPTWQGGTSLWEGGYNWANVGNTFTHMYVKHYPDPVSTAQLLAKRHASLLRRVLAWQQVVYSDRKLPIWLRDSLINSLYMITEDGLWAQKKKPLPDWVREEDGLFGMIECPRGCPQIECIPCSFYGSLPLAYFFPELQLSTIRGYKGYQYPGGIPPWRFGYRTEFADPGAGLYQAATNGISLAGIVDRFLMCRDTSDKELTKELYPMIKECTKWTVGLRQTPSYSIGEKIIAMPEPDGNVVGLEWFELSQPGWFGMVSHIGTLHIAQLRITERMARDVGDTEFAGQCAEWIKAATEAMENRLWDQRGYYINFFKPETGDKSDLVFGYLLDGEWVMDHHGLASPLPQDHVRLTLETIKRCNIALTKYGATNLCESGRDRGEDTGNRRS
ncbi:MAG: GH116 family glycosyl-hydrolase [Armatimonadota bacterium]